MSGIQSNWVEGNLPASDYKSLFDILFGKRPNLQQAAALKFACPECRAKVGKPCKEGRLTLAPATHTFREELAQREQFIQFANEGRWTA